MRQDQKPRTAVSQVRFELPAPIVASWKRSEDRGIDRDQPRYRRVTGEELSGRLSAASTLVDAARPHLQWLSAHFAAIPHVAYLTDADGVVLCSFGDPGLQQAFRVTPGYDWSERTMGTNGAGTALASGIPVAVVGAEHYVTALQNCSCVAAPIKDDAGRNIGAIDLSTSVADGGPQHTSLMTYVALMIERDVLHSSGGSERAGANKLASELEQREGKLRDALDRLQLILDNAPVFIYLVDTTAHVLNANRAFASAFGSAGTVVGRSLYELFPGETAKQFDDNNRRVMQTGSVLRLEETQDNRTYLSVKVPVRDATGTPYAVCGMSVDISEQKDAERKLLQSEARLQQADRTKNEFIAMVAHELRSPLSAIHNCVEILGLAGLRPADGEAARQLVKRQVQHLVCLADDLLDISRGTLGKLVLRRDVVDLRDIAADAVVGIDGQLREAQQQFVVEQPAQPVWVDGDRVRLGQVIANLLNNAARYTPRGGEITLRVESDGHEAIVSVEDNGIGLAAHEIASIFEPFVQGDAAASGRGGLGIGLALVRTLVDVHGGTVTARSDGRDRGSMFVVRLPLASKPPSA